MKTFFGMVVGKGAHLKFGCCTLTECRTCFSLLKDGWTLFSAPTIEQLERYVKEEIDSGTPLGLGLSSAIQGLPRQKYLIYNHRTHQFSAGLFPTDDYRKAKLYLSRADAYVRATELDGVVITEAEARLAWREARRAAQAKVLQEITDRFGPEES